MSQPPQVPPQLTRGGLPVTPEQSKVVDSVLGRLLTVVSAGAGAGKTHTTVAAVLALLEARMATMDRFIMITFANDAADELRERMEHELRERLLAAENAGDQGERQFWQEQQELLSAALIGTIHGFCRELLRNFGHGNGIARSYDVTFARSLFTDAVQNAVEATLQAPFPLLGPDYDWDAYRLHRLVAEILTALRNAGASVGDLLMTTRDQAADPGKPYRVALAELVAAADARYSALKQEKQALDASDLLTKTAELLEGSAAAAVKSHLQGRYDYLFVDEFQDTDHTQKRMIDALLKPECLRGILVVGDKKQSIYRFRGANVSLLDKLAIENGVDVMPLSISRRPTQELLAAQNALFKSMATRYGELGEVLARADDSLKPTIAPPPLIYASAGEQARLQDRVTKTARAINWLLQQQIQDPTTKQERQVQTGDIVVLCRSNWQLLEYYRGLQAEGLQVQMVGSGLFYQKPEIVGAFRILRLLLHYPDDTVLSLALDTPFLAQVAATPREQWILKYGAEDGTPLTDWFREEYSDLHKKLQALRAAVRRETVPQLLATLYDEFGIREHYQRQGKHQELENLEKLRELARRLFGVEQALTLRQFVGYLGVQINSRKEESEAQIGTSAGQDQTPPEHVRLMTVHGAKGQQFPLVIIPEVQKQLRPSEDPDFLIDADGTLDVAIPRAGVNTRSPRFQSTLAEHLAAHVQEEMRILYVAVTRAQHAVLLIGSGSMRPKQPGDTYYSWKDEVLQAWPALAAAKAKMVPD